MPISYLHYTRLIAQRDNLLNDFSHIRIQNIQRERTIFDFFRFEINNETRTTRREKEAGVAERATRDKIAGLVTVSTTRDRALS